MIGGRGASCGNAVCYFTQKLDATLAEDKSHIDIYSLETTFVPQRERYTKTPHSALLRHLQYLWRVKPGNKQQPRGNDMDMRVTRAARRRQHAEAPKERHTCARRGRCSIRIGSRAERRWFQKQDERMKKHDYSLLFNPSIIIIKYFLTSVLSASSKITGTLHWKATSWVSVTLFLGAIFGVSHQNRLI